MDKSITIQLTLRQAEKLSEVIESVEDEGPINAGWASDELCELRSLVVEAIERAKG